MINSDKRIVITGGNSLIGQHLIEILSKTQYSISAVVRDPTGIKQNEKVSYLKASLKDYPELYQRIDRCDTFVSLAWDGGRRNQLDDEERNRFSAEAIEGAIHSLVEHCGCRKVILAGSHYEYSQQNLPIEENSDEHPTLAYGKNKLRLYRRVREYCDKRGVTCIELRLFSVYGSGVASDKMINTIIGRLQRNENVVLKHGKQMYSFLHANDAADAFVRVIEAEPCDSGHFNVASNIHMQLYELVDIMRTTLGSKSEVRCEDDCLIGGPHTVVLSGKMRRVFSWTPKTSFASGIKEIAEDNVLNGEKN